MKIVRQQAGCVPVFQKSLSLTTMPSSDERLVGNNIR